MIEEITRAVLKLVDQYSVTKVILFGSRADGTNCDDSDVDLIMEFSIPVSLLTLSMIKIELEEMLGVKVDLVHGPVTSADILEINKEIVLYAA